MTSPIPPEFSEKVIAATSDSAATPYRDFVHSREPYQSLYEANPNMRPPKTGERLLWGEDKYYDTTVARKYTYWKDLSLPKPKKDVIHPGFYLRHVLLYSSCCRHLRTYKKIELMQEQPNKKER